MTSPHPLSCSTGPTARPAPSPASPTALLGLPSRGPHGSRSAMTCAFRCGNACDQPIPNVSGNEEFHTVAERAMARRQVLRGGVAAAAVGVLAFSSAAPAAAGPRHPRPRPGPVARAGAGTWSFTPVPPNRADEVSVPDGFTTDLLIAWGDPVTRDAARFDVRRQSAAAARTQFGYNNDYVGLVPHPRRKDRALLVVNHEYTDEPLMFPSGTHTPQQVLEVAIASHGMSVVEVQRGRLPGQWSVVRPRSARHNRRLHDRTVFEMTGPAAGDARLRTSGDPSGRRVLGTFNNCAGGTTPWGTVLSGEENFNQYFDASGELDPRHAASYARYGITGAGRGWSAVDRRFDLSVEPHEPYRFGWVVEVDPTDPTSRPRKHTMLGRFKHEGANVTIADSGHVVAYMGDDERGDYLYRFTSRSTYDPRPSARARRHNLTLLTEGTLWVARLDGDGPDDGVHDGTGEWIRLADDRRSYVPGMSVAEVLIDTRLAADQVSPTRMDRPEDVEVNPVNGRVYAALTNNSNRGTRNPPDEANPVSSSYVRAALGAPLTRASGNRNGYVLELEPGRGGHTGTTFAWNLMLVCGDPQAPETWFAGFPKQLVSPISCPDNVAFDAVGNLWISTDGNALGSNDGLFRVPVDGSRRGLVEQFLTVPLGAETCGPFIAPDQQSVLVAVQHPGEVDGATFESPASTWPHTHTFPRPGVVVVRRA
ncbi:PhoX family protein [Nocardioides jishulii]|uniref:PhoX family phosphatase n=1 Tax=Nocardioides jishulii TaxID=2575440 RepID=A0A4U2YLY5_9ACTN|nr:PhoX family phosphatase [Nocardioides jishulii]QCX27430.1 PhoX family phosphatase [Nocardioides jishulii]TKI62236.1 PhoX family phosphatase [Nocardioides jishulii]